MKCAICGNDKKDVSLSEVSKEYYEKIKHLIKKSNDQPENRVGGFKDLRISICKGCQDSI